MRVRAKCVQKIYKFRCPFCGSLLETDNEEEMSIDPVFEKLFNYYCPVCKTDRFVNVQEVDIEYDYEELQNDRWHPN